VESVISEWFDCYETMQFWYDAEQLKSILMFAGPSKTDLMKVSPDVKLSDVTVLLGQFIQFTHTGRDNAEGDQNNKPSVFTVLMAGARKEANSSCLPESFSMAQYPRKNKLKNDILIWLEQNSLGWTFGITFVNTVGDALWYIDRNHEALRKRGCSVPIVFQQFSGYRVPENHKKQKLDETSLRSDGIRAPSAALYNLALSSYMKKDTWKSVYAAVLALAHSLQKYGEYLTSHAKCVSLHQFTSLTHLLPGMSHWF